MTRTMSETIETLALLHQAYCPLARVDSETVSGCPKGVEVRRVVSVIAPMLNDLEGELAHGTPETPREALALALMLLEFMQLADTHPGEDGSPPKMGQYGVAAKTLVAYLAKMAGTHPRELGLFLWELEHEGMWEPRTWAPIVPWPAPEPPRAAELPSAAA